MSTSQSEGWFQVRSRVDPSQFTTARRAVADEDDGEETYGLASTEWHPGVRVLAPWEPVFLYTGTVTKVDDDRALVEYDDGGAGWVAMRELRAFELRLDQPVMCRREQGPFYFTARIIEMRDTEVRVRYDDGTREWTHVACLRFVCVAPGIGIKVVTPADWQGFYENLCEGTRVWAPWDAAALHAGSVTKIRGDKVHIAYDDGDEGWTLLVQILPLALPIGLRVWRRAAWSGDDIMATLVRLEGARLLLRDDKTEVECWLPLAKVAVPCAPIGPNARPTKVAFRMTPAHWAWLIGGLIGLGFLLLMMTTRN